MSKEKWNFTIWGLRIYKKLQRYKALPSEIKDNNLGMYMGRKAIYEKIFKKKDDLTSHVQRQKMFQTFKQNFEER